MITKRVKTCVKNEKENTAKRGKIGVGDFYELRSISS